MIARFHPRLDDIPAAHWNALLPDDNPFLDHAFLSGLEQQGCIDRHAGWQPHHLGLYEGSQLIAAAPLYLKSNSHGEFVFDWTWADAYAQHGLNYYPKLLCGVPYSPVTGPRLLAAADAPARQTQLIAAIQSECSRLGLSSAHLNFAADQDLDAFAHTEWLARSDWQFHWHADPAWRDFDDFLDALTHKKRKNIRHERRQVADAGIECEIRHGHELDAAHWQALHDFYLATFEDKGNYAALTLGFFRHLGRHLPERVVAVLCRRGPQLVAGALMLRSSTTLYGRYWGARESIPALHFEACYYRGIDYCLSKGLTTFEPGAGGLHKLARGFLPTPTRSFHWISDSRFRNAIASAVRHETPALQHAHAEWLAHSPYAERPREPAR